nr:hypothetical protein CFP56_41767 [Quercus suber]
MMAYLVEFECIPIWVQVWGFPFDLVTEEAGQDIGGSIGKVEFPLKKPIKRGAPVPSSNGDKVWIAFQARGRLAKDPRRKKQASLPQRNTERAKDQARDQAQPPWEQQMGETNGPVVRQTITNGELEGNQCTETGVYASKVNRISVEYALNGMRMVTDISKVHEFKILGKELVMVPIMYIEENNDNNRGESKSETLAAKVELNESRGLTCDMKKTKGFETRNKMFFGATIRAGATFQEHQALDDEVWPEHQAFQEQGWPGSRGSQQRDPDCHGKGANNNRRYYGLGVPKFEAKVDTVQLEGYYERYETLLVTFLQDFTCEGGDGSGRGGDGKDGSGSDSDDGDSSGSGSDCEGGDSSGSGSDDGDGSGDDGGALLSNLSAITMGQTMLNMAMKGVGQAISIHDKTLKEVAKKVWDSVTGMDVVKLILTANAISLQTKKTLLVTFLQDFTCEGGDGSGRGGDGKDGSGSDSDDGDSSGSGSDCEGGDSSGSGSDDGDGSGDDGNGWD